MPSRLESDVDSRPMCGTRPVTCKKSTCKWSRRKSRRGGGVLTLNHSLKHWWWWLATYFMRHNRLPVTCVIVYSVYVASEAASDRRVRVSIQLGWYRRSVLGVWPRDCSLCPRLSTETLLGLRHIMNKAFSRSLTTAERSHCGTSLPYQNGYA